MEICRNISIALLFHFVLYIFSNMARRRKQPVLLGLQAACPQSLFFHLDRGDLDRILEVLNWKPQGRPSLYAGPLIHLMGRLKECGGNLKRMMDGDPELAETVAKVCVTRWVPSQRRRAYLVLQPVWKEILEPELTDGVQLMRPERYATLVFHVGTLNPEWDKLTGPCSRCKNYFIKKRASQTVYCSRACGNAATAVGRTRERLKLEREDKIKRIKVALREWRAVRGKEDWKDFVSRETGIDRRFLTRHFTSQGKEKHNEA
jgi:hypothetical protein